MNEPTKEGWYWADKKLHFNHTIRMIVFVRTWKMSPEEGKLIVLIVGSTKTHQLSEFQNWSEKLPENAN